MSEQCNNFEQQIKQEEKSVIGKTSTFCRVAHFCTYLECLYIVVIEIVHLCMYLECLYIVVIEILIMSEFINVMFLL